MVRFKDVSIRSKVFLILYVALLFQVLIALTGLYYLDQTSRNMETMADKEARAIRTGGRVNSYFREMVIAEKNMLLLKARDAEASYRNIFADNRRNLEEHLSKLRKTINPPIAANLDEFETYYRQYLSTHQRIHELRAKNEDAEAIRVSTETARDQRCKARDALTPLINDLDEAMNQSVSENQATTRIAMTLMIVILFATLIVSFGAGLLATRAITSGLHILIASTDRMAQGDMSARADILTGDEIGVLGAASG